MKFNLFWNDLTEEKREELFAKVKEAVKKDPDEMFEIDKLALETWTKANPTCPIEVIVNDLIEERAGDLVNRNLFIQGEI